MYNIEIHNFINKIIESFYRLRLWNVLDDTPILVNVLKHFQLLYFASFVLSMATGAFITNEKDEFIFLIVAAMINGVIVYRMATIIGKKNEILGFIGEFGRHSNIKNKEDFVQINNQLDNLIKFAKAFVWMCVVGVTFAMFVPVTSSERKLVFNIALPTQWKRNDIIFWVAHLYSVLGCTYSSHSLLLSIIVWYLMVNCAVKYKLLGNQLRDLGVQNNLVSKEERPKFMMRELIAVIKAHLKINKYYRHVCITR